MEIYPCTPYVCTHICTCVSTSTATAVDIDKDRSHVFLERSFPCRSPGRWSLPFTFHSHVRSSARVFGLAMWSPVWFTISFHIYSILVTTVWEGKLGRHSPHFTDQEREVSWCSHEPGGSELSASQHRAPAPDQTTCLAESSFHSTLWAQPQPSSNLKPPQPSHSPESRPWAPWAPYPST